jgi:ribosomal-protein-alanine N-acetyltransferase
LPHQAATEGAAYPHSVGFDAGNAAMPVSHNHRLNVHIRWMIRRDMPEVLAIEERSFEFPWSEDDFVRCLRQRNCIGMVAERDERVVGFMIYELHKNRLHILNFSVHDQFRRRGVGTQLIRKLISKLAPQRRNRILLEVRETNLGAQLFFRDLGFRAISLLRDFYEDTTEDAYLMQYRYVPGVAGLAIDERPRRLAG